MSPMKNDECRMANVEWRMSNAPIHHSTFPIQHSSFAVSPAPLRPSSFALHPSHPPPVTAPLIVAIDGPSGVGKSTASKLVARALGIPHIDTGAMYRAIGLAAKRAGVSTRDEAALEALANAVPPDSTP